MKRAVVALVLLALITGALLGFAGGLLVAGREVRAWQGRLEIAQDGLESAIADVRKANAATEKCIADLRSGNEFLRRLTKSLGR